jgi:Holliday junction resolvase RusA-like endonuclease
MKSIELNITPMGAVRTTQAGKYCDSNYLKYKKYKNALYLLLRSKGVSECPKELIIDFVMPFFDSYSDKKKAKLLNFPHMQKPDLDNLVKGFMDCFGKDDSGVYMIQTRKYWGESGKIILYMPDSK